MGINEVTSRAFNQKVLVIGLDGATFDVMKPMIRRGELPTISGLIHDGVHGVLESTVPDLSPVAWTSMVTGKRPGKHAIFDFISRQRGSYDFRSAVGGNRQAKPIWSYLSEKGKLVGALNVTMSYPPEKVNGFVVSGLDSPGLNSTFTYPPSLRDEINEKVGKYILVNPYALTTRDKHLQGMFEMIDNRFATTNYLMEKFEWDFFMVVFIATDGVQHFYWKDMDPAHPYHDATTPERFRNAIRDVYMRVDRGINEILKKLSEDVTIILVSDHGFQPLHKLFVLNNWLIQEGYLCLKKGIMNSDALKKVRILGRKVKDRFNPGSGRRAMRGDDFLRSVDWQKTRAFADGTFGHIYLNVKGREPEGIVDPGREYDELCEEFARRLKSITDPDNGNRVVEEVYKGRDLFDGVHMENAPDLVVTDKPTYFVSASVDRLPMMKDSVGSGNELFQRHVWSGNHKHDGIFILYGPDIRKGYKVDGARIIDIAPTILYLLGQEIPEDMDGKILLDVFSSEYADTHVPVFVKGEDVSEAPEEILPDEDEAIKDRLRDLGYLD
jgi:predicted AlkP superfamily phosphohydrolase/phosphomutase